MSHLPLPDFHVKQIILLSFIYASQCQISLLPFSFALDWVCFVLSAGCVSLYSFPDKKLNLIIFWLMATKSFHYIHKSWGHTANFSLEDNKFIQFTCFLSFFFINIINDNRMLMELQKECEIEFFLTDKIKFYHNVFRCIQQRIKILSTEWGQ